MTIFIDQGKFGSAGSGYNNEYQASARKDLFVFETQYGGNGVDTISGFGTDDMLRLRGFDGAFSDLTFEVDSSEKTITIRYDSSDNKIVLRNVADLIDSNGNHLLTADNFHFTLTGSSKEGVELSGGSRGSTFLELKSDSGAVLSRLEGTSGDDTLLSGSVDSTLIGGKGYDVLKGFSGDDFLKGGSGHDRLHGYGGNDILKGNKGHDYLDGGRGNDILHAGKGQDILDGSWGDDTLYGNKGDDFMEGSWGADTFVFREGDGHDIIKDFGFGWSGDDDPDLMAANIKRLENNAKRLEKLLLETEDPDSLEIDSALLALENRATDKIQLHLDVAADTTDEAAFRLLNIQQQGNDTVIGYGNAGDMITLKGVSEVTIDDFDFVLIG